MAQPDITIMALDVATNTGVAWWNIRSHHSAIQTRTIKLKSETHEQKAAEAGRLFRELLREVRPHFVSIEAPLKAVARFKKKGKPDIFGAPGEESTTINPASVILPNQLTGALLGQIGICGLPWVMISEETWRKCFLGYGRKKGWSRDDYKRAVRQQCEMLGIDVPNNDVADAVGVLWATQSNQHFKAFKNDFEQALRSAA